MKQAKEQLNFFKKVKAKEKTGGVDMLAYLYRFKPFIIYTDASNHIMGGITTKDGQVFSKKFNEAQIKDSTKEQEMIAIAESLKYHTISCMVGKS